MRRQEKIFWLRNPCPTCEHSSQLIYKPDLIDGPIACECQSKHNVFRKLNVCHAKWDIAATPEERETIMHNLMLATRKDSCAKEVHRINNILDEIIR